MIINYWLDFILKLRFANPCKPVRDEIFVHLQGDSAQFQARPTFSRLITEFIPERYTITVEYECLPSYSSIQFAEIIDTNGAVVVQRFGLRSGKNFAL